MREGLGQGGVGVWCEHDVSGECVCGDFGEWCLWRVCVRMLHEELHDATVVLFDGMVVFVGG